MRRHIAKTAANILRYCDTVLSDEHCKQIKEDTDIGLLAEAILKNGGPFNEKETRFLAEAIGASDDEDWDDDILEKYADNIMNYKYTYKEEAKDVDPSIDTSEEHIGPMAQDIEKVNPAAVHADPATGYKTVDTGRLALMNAGAIADLAREIRELKGVRD